MVGRVGCRKIFYPFPQRLHEISAEFWGQTVQGQGIQHSQNCSNCACLGNAAQELTLTSCGQSLLVWKLEFFLSPLSQKPMLHLHCLVEIVQILPTRPSYQLLFLEDIPHSRHRDIPLHVLSPLTHLQFTKWACPKSTHTLICRVRTKIYSCLTQSLPLGFQSNYYKFPRFLQSAPSIHPIGSSLQAEGCFESRIENFY